MKEIKLTIGKVTIVDDSDFDFLNQWKWFAKREGHTFYAARTQRDADGKKITIRMHRLLLSATDKNIFIDHVDRNGLNNQRINLRFCNRSQNQANRKSQQNSTSKYIGVSKVHNRPGWIASISKENKKISSKYFLLETDAAQWYNEQAKEHHGEFANQNIIEL